MAATRMRPIQHTISLETARAIIDRAAAPLGRTERIALGDANGRIVAGEVTAGADVPPFARAAMDGYAVRAEDTSGASRDEPKILQRIEIVYTGMRPGEKLYEELFGEGELRAPTAHQEIQLAQSCWRYTEAELNERIGAVLDASRLGNEEQLTRALMRLVPYYSPASQVPIPEASPRRGPAIKPTVSSTTHAPVQP